MLYGTKTHQTFYRDGNVNDTVTTYSESVKVTVDTDVLAEFLKLLEIVKQQGRFNPTFEIITDRRSNQVLRIIRTWSEA